MHSRPTPTAGSLERLTDELVASSGDVAERALLELTGSVWNEGRLTPDAPAVARHAATLVERQDTRRCSRLVLMLGLLVEGGSGTDDGPYAAPTREAVKSELGTYLELLAGAGDDPALRSSLLFLLAHFPDRGAEIVDVARSAPLDEDELTQLECCLESDDLPSVRQARRTGRLWPSPAAWEAAERAGHDDRGASNPVSYPPDEAAEL